MLSQVIAHYSMLWYTVVYQRASWQIVVYSSRFSQNVIVPSYYGVCQYIIVSLFLSDLLLSCMICRLKVLHFRAVQQHSVLLYYAIVYSITVLFLKFLYSVVFQFVIAYIMICIILHHTLHHSIYIIQYYVLDVTEIL